MVDPIDDKAARLLGALAHHSAMRAEDGKTFWAGYFRHRVQRFAGKPLRDFVSRMIDECRVHSVGAQEVVHLLGELDEQTTLAIEESLRERGALIVALCYDYRKGAEKCQTSLAL